jgi:hypothetical protein
VWRWPDAVNPRRSSSGPAFFIDKGHSRAGEILFTRGKLPDDRTASCRSGATGKVRGLIERGAPRRTRKAARPATGHIVPRVATGTRLVVAVQLPDRRAPGRRQRRRVLRGLQAKACRPCARMGGRSSRRT